MSFTTVLFFAFLFLGVIVYYLLPGKVQWVWLLILSYLYYFSFSVKTAFFMIFTTAVIYGGGIWLTRLNRTSKAYIQANKESITKEEKKAYKTQMKHKKRQVLTLMLVLIFGLLAIVKYTNFVIINLDSLFAVIGHGPHINPMKIILPIGISFYTFQSASYIIDIYQGKYECERNPFKYALFVSFFPQLLQGPIGRFDRLAHQLYAEHRFQLINIQFGLQRIGWGIFKKVVLADRVSGLVNNVFGNYGSYGGFYNIVAVLMYTVQLYMDFSGGIDIVIGAAEMFGIHMDENFRQPFFSKSTAEVWRRWHITLGAWMKDYIFYPMSLSSRMNKVSKWGKKKFGPFYGKQLPVCIANILIFFIVGLWHGAAWKYIAYGLYNGLIISFSAMMEPTYKKWFQFFHINGESSGWKVVQMLRTSLLIVISFYFDMAVDLHAALSMMYHSIVDFRFGQLTDPCLFGMGMTLRDYLVVLGGCIVVLVVSILKERGVRIRESLAAKPIIVRWTAYYGLIMVILLLGYVGATQGFIYANF